MTSTSLLLPIVCELFRSSQRSKERLLQNHSSMQALLLAGETLREQSRNGGTIVVSAVPSLQWKAHHFIEELVGRYKVNRPSVPAIWVSPRTFPVLQKRSMCPRDTFVNFIYGANGALSLEVRAPVSGERVVEVPLGQGPLSELSSLLSLVVHLLCEFFEPESTQRVSLTWLQEMARLSLEVDEKCLEDKLFLDQCRQSEPTLLRLEESGGWLFAAGNGGSACDCGDAWLLSSSLEEAGSPYPFFVAPADLGTTTCIANDWAFEKVFSRALSGFSIGTCCFLGISTSGNSGNILEGMATAASRDFSTIFLGGGSGGKLKEECSVPIIVPTDATERIQEAHATLIAAFMLLLRGYRGDCHAANAIR